MDRSAPIPFSSCPVDRNPLAARGSFSITRSVRFWLHSRIEVQAIKVQAIASFIDGSRHHRTLRARGGGLLLDRYNFADVLALEDDRVAASSAPFPGCVMVNQLPTDEPSSACALCGQPFNVHNNHVYAWRSTSGKLYCSEFCADDEDEEARFPYRRRA